MMNSAFVAAILWIAITAADSSTLPVYVSILYNPSSKPSTYSHHASCDVTNCCKEILENPVFIVSKLNGQTRYEVNYAPKGLNNLSKDVTTRPVNEAIRAGDKVAVVYTHAGFPAEQFPGILETYFIVPEHKISFSEFFRDKPILVLYSNEDFSKLNDKLNYVKVADLDVQNTGISLSKEYFLPTFPSDSTDVKDYHLPLFYILPASTPLDNHRHTTQYIAPSTETYTPLYSGSIVAYAPAPPPNSVPSGIGASSPFF